MKRKCLIVALAMISCVLFLQTGCQEQAKPANEAMKAISELKQNGSLDEEQDALLDELFQYLVAQFSNKGCER